VRDGRDVLFAFGHMVQPALEAAEALGEGRPVARRGQRPLRQAARPGHDPALRRSRAGPSSPSRKASSTAARGAPCASSSTGKAGSTSGSRRSGFRPRLYPMGKSDEIRAAARPRRSRARPADRGFPPDAPFLRRR
ncbi:MAG: hypothetical protein M0C28_05280, partial [Candidatus Moduliflexus flocculans]|nr:hypothetical protein [Candidatus Moduliflexus flocculans]